MVHRGIRALVRVGIMRAKGDGIALPWQHRHAPSAAAEEEADDDEEQDREADC